MASYEDFLNSYNDSTEAVDINSYKNNMNNGNIQKNKRKVKVKNEAVKNKSNKKTNKTVVKSKNRDYVNNSNKKINQKNANIDNNELVKENIEKAKQYKKLENAKKNKKYFKAENQLFSIIKLDKKFVNLPLSMYLLIAYIFFATSMLMYISSKVEVQRFELNELNAIYKDLLEEKSQLELNVSLSNNIDKIEEIAINELGMVKPEEYQIFHIDVPPQNYVQYESTQNDNVGVFEKIKNFIKGII